MNQETETPFANIKTDVQRRRAAAFIDVLSEHKTIQVHLEAVLGLGALPNARDTSENLGISRVTSGVNQSLVTKQLGALAEYLRDLADAMDTPIDKQVIRRRMGEVLHTIAQSTTMSMEQKTQAVEQVLRINGLEQGKATAHHNPQTDTHSLFVDIGSFILDCPSDREYLMRPTQS